MLDIFTSSSNRRTLYGKVDRLQLPGVYRAFDYPDPSSSNPKRDRTTVAPQALFLMNHPFAIECAAALSKRPEIAAEADLSKRVDRVYHVLYSRPPSEREVEVARSYIGAGSNGIWEQYFQALLMSNEFMYID